MRLIGAGLPRTGTLSQKIALEMLGLDPCYHMVNVLGNLPEAARWRQVFDGSMPVTDILDEFPATVDWPGSYYTKQLVEAYPDAKVLLSVRSGESWAASMRETVWGVLYGSDLQRHMSDARSCIDPEWRDCMNMLREMWQASGLLNGDATTAESMAAAMEAYNQDIIASVPADRLLVWTASEGWGPICEFLGLPVPDVEFPRVNDKAEFADRIINPALAIVQQHQQPGAPVPA